MPGAFSPSAALLAALRHLRQLMQAENVPLPDATQSTQPGMSDEMRRMQVLIDHMNAQADQLRPAPPAAAPPSPTPQLPIPPPGALPFSPQRPSFSPPRVSPFPPPPAPPPVRSVTLANARAGLAYLEHPTLPGLGPLVLVDDGGSGLAGSPDGALAGLPVQSGDFRLRFTALDGGTPVEVHATLSVIPDPRSLWISLDSDRNDPYWKPDAETALIDDALRCIAASKRGRSHARTGAFRDDDFGIAAAGGWQVAVVADGAGSARLSRLGSRVAVETVIETLPAALAAPVPEDPAASDEADPALRDLLVHSAAEAARMVAREAEACGAREAELATTLVIVAVRRLATDWLVAGFGIGDGAAAVLDVGAGTLVPLMTPDSGAFAGQTRFLEAALFVDRPAMAARVHIARVPAFTAILLMTDGVSDAKFPTDAVLAAPAAWRAFWTDDLAATVPFSAPADEARASLLDWLDFWSRGNHDDRTLAVLIPREAAA